MATQPKVHHAVPADALTVLKPQKLGRHYHKIPNKIKEAASKHPRLISDYFLRTYRINTELTAVRVHDSLERSANFVYASELGKLGFSIDRRLLAEALESYYGGTIAPQDDMPPISASEQRLQARLGKHLIDIFARLMLSGEKL